MTDCKDAEIKKKKKKIRWLSPILYVSTRWHQWILSVCRWYFLVLLGPVLQSV